MLQAINAQYFIKPIVLFACLKRATCNRINPQVGDYVLFNVSLLSSPTVNRPVVIKPNLKIKACVWNNRHNEVVLILCCWKSVQIYLNAVLFCLVWFCYSKEEKCCVFLFISADLLLKIFPWTVITILR